MEKKKLLIKIFFIFLVAYLVFGLNFNKKFYGFEYEDSFINSHVASVEDIKEYTRRFRTLGCQEMLEGNCISKYYHSGHYISYSLYLHSVNKVFNVENFKVHKIANGFLFLLILFVLSFSISTKDFILFCLFFASCLPIIYVMNSSLIENLSFTLGIIFILISRKINTNKKISSYTLLFLTLTLLCVVKRENLIYLLLLPLVLSLNQLKSIKFFVFALFFLIIQIYINPFHTEIIESESIQRSTFSIDYLQYQLPVYLSSFLRFDGFLPIAIFIFILKKPNKKSLYILSVWFLFILIYSLHYRGQFSIDLKKINHFETFRYMFNTLPFLFGYFIYSKKISLEEGRFRKFIYISLGLFSIFLININFFKFEEFLIDENINYHAINDNINKHFNVRKDNISIYDNFELISMLNNERNHKVNIFSLNEASSFRSNDKILIINRFNIYNMDNLKSSYNIIHRSDLSTESSSVYILEEPKDYKNK